MLNSTTLRRLLSSTYPPLPSFWGLTPSLWLAFLVFSSSLLSDLITTFAALASGRAYEANPSVAHILLLGPLALTAFKLFSILVVYLLSRLFVIYANPRYLFIFSFALYVVALLFFVISFSNLMATFFSYDLFTLLFPSLFR